MTDNNIGQFTKGISEMAKKCPWNGCVSATFSFHAGEVRGIEVSSERRKSDGSEEKAVKVFTPVITQMLLYKLDRKKQYYGSVTVTVSIANGEYRCAEFVESEKVSLRQAESLVKTERNRLKRAA